MKGISFLSLFLLVACRSPQPKHHPIETPIESKHDEYRSCFLESESYKGRNTVENGVVAVSFTINQDGKVINAKIAESAFKDANFHACLLDQIRSLKFGLPKDGKNIDVVRPINFYPRTNE